jgi:glycosyltransferase involved in cell wall biosynthesis
MKPAAIVTFHTNPYTCGVARFNVALAQSLGVPLLTLEGFLENPVSGALLSIKCEEIGEVNSQGLSDFLETASESFDVYLHGLDGSAAEQKIIEKAGRLFTATKEMADLVGTKRGDVVSTFAPGASPSPIAKEVDCTLLTFGMAHKIRVAGYRKLGELLQEEKRTFRLEISTALHEGTTFSEDFFTVGKEIREVFDGNVSFLGFLADEEVSNRMRAADALVAFFPHGVRENNTTVLSAMSHGCAVITNIDKYSPSWMAHNHSIFDINLLDGFPSINDLERVGSNAIEAVNNFTFSELAKLITNNEIK